MLVKNELRIWQNNLHKSRERTHGILNDPDMKQYAVLLLQEQYWSAYTNTSPRHHAWTLFEPMTKKGQPRSAVYVNNLIAAAQIMLPFDDITAVRLEITNSKPMLIINRVGHHLMSITT
jgi:hypothetical protein